MVSLVSEVLQNFEKAAPHGDWWDVLNEEEQKYYLKQHPHSRLKPKQRSKEIKSSLGLTRHLKELFPDAKIELFAIHKSHVQYVADELTHLKEQYPYANYDMIRIYQPSSKVENKFLQNDNCFARGGQGMLLLNYLWYAAPVENIIKADQNAAQGRSAMVVEKPNGFKTALMFHNGMTDPASTITHEFGHNLHETLEGMGNKIMFADMVQASDFGMISGTTDKFVRYHWQQALKDPYKAVSAYALTNAKEWFAETFAAVKYGDKETQKKPQVKFMRNFLKIIGNSNNHKPARWPFDQDSGGKPLFTTEQIRANYNKMIKIAKAIGLPKSFV